MKTVIKMIGKEIEAAEEYIECAYKKKANHPSTAELFITLAGEEIAHAEKLLKHGHNLVDDMKSAAKTASASDSTHEHNRECLIIWNWEYERAIAEIAELKFEIDLFKRM